MLRFGGRLVLAVAVVFAAPVCHTHPPPDSGISGTFFVAHTTGSVPSPFPTAPPWPGVNGTVAPGAGTLTIRPESGAVQTVDVDGAFRVPLTPGRYTIVGTAGGGGSNPSAPMVVTVLPHEFTRIRVVVIGSGLP